MTSSAEPPVIRAAGGVVWRPDAGNGTGNGTGNGIETAVVHRPRYDDWSLPKGKLDAGEHALAAAVREVAEETGLSVVVGRRSLRTGYAVEGGTKQVDYWLMRAVGGGFAPNDEVDELRWLPVSEAVALVTHDHDREVLADLARTDVPRAPALLLVRHASAGDRDEWDGPDELRPLDGKGSRQARRLAGALPLLGVGEVLSARPVRCRETVTPLAARLGVPLREAPEFGEEEFQHDPQAALAAVERYLQRPADSGPVVVCSQGGAIPSLLMALGVRWEGVAGRLWPPAAKGSTWALGGRPGALVADYYRSFAPDADARTR